MPGTVSGSDAQTGPSSASAGVEPTGTVGLLKRIHLALWKWQQAQRRGAPRHELLAAEDELRRLADALE